MPPQMLSIAHLDYLLRADVDPTITPATVPTQHIALSRRRLPRIIGVRRLDKASTGGPRSRPVGISSQDLLAGLYGAKIPLAFLVSGAPDGTSICVGTWLSGEREDPDRLSRQDAVLHTVLGSLYTAIDTTASDTELPVLERVGMSLGLPSSKAPDQQDGALPLDRLIRALGRGSRACLVLAQPVAKSEVALLRD